VRAALLAALLCLATALPARGAGLSIGDTRVYENDELALVAHRLGEDAVIVLAWHRDPAIATAIQNGGPIWRSDVRATVLLRENYAHARFGNVLLYAEGVPQDPHGAAIGPYELRIGADEALLITDLGHTTLYAIGYASAAFRPFFSHQQCGAENRGETCFGPGGGAFEGFVLADSLSDFADVLIVSPFDGGCEVVQGRRGRHDEPPWIGVAGPACTPWSIRLGLCFRPEHPAHLCFGSNRSEFGGSYAVAWDQEMRWADWWYAPNLSAPWTCDPDFPHGRGEIVNRRTAPHRDGTAWPAALLLPGERQGYCRR
jgi:hypothetical protein